MKLNDNILNVWIDDISRKITKVVDSQIMYLTTKDEMEEVVFSDDIVDKILIELKEKYDCSEYDDWDIVSSLRDIQNDRIDKYVYFLEQLNNNNIEKLLGKKPTYKEIAEYLGVSESAVKQYRPDRRELIKLGLWLKRAMKD